MSRIIFRESAAPTTPASGQMTLFADTNGDLSWLDDGGNLTTLVTTGAATITLPNATDTIAVLGTQQTFTARPIFSTTIGVGSATPSTSGSGITFPATQSPSSNANTLDDYEEGTWTPSYTTTGNPFGSVAYTASRVGIYTKVGRLVTASFVIQTSSVTLGSASADVLISGLPFAVGSTLAQAGTLSYVAAFADNRPSAILAEAGGSFAYLYYRDTADGNTINLTPADLALGAASNLIWGVLIYSV